MTIHELMRRARETGTDTLIHWPQWHCPAVIVGASGTIVPVDLYTGPLDVETYRVRRSHGA